MNFVHHLDQPIVKKQLLISSVGFILGVSLYFFFKGTTQNALEAIASGFIGVSMSYMLYMTSRKLDELLPWKSQLAARFVSGILGHFAILFVSISLLAYVHELIFPEVVEPLNEIDSFDDDFIETPDSFLIKLGIIVSFIVLVYNIVYFALYSYYHYAKGQIDEITYQRKQTDLQLKALKSQLSAHFLFNNLNTISSLAYKDDKKAEQYIRGMATIYNYTLNSYHKRLVNLKEELQCVTSYLGHIRTRFGEAINYSINISEALQETKIPPLTLQMLVENAVKHNQIDADHQLNITISASKKHLEVSNNITKAPKNVKSFHVGLKNIAERYKLISGKDINTEKNTDFTVRLPILDNE